MIVAPTPASTAAWANVAARIAANTDRLDPVDLPVGCLKWRLGNGGYGVMSLPNAIQAEGWPKVALAHRVACAIAHGPPPEPGLMARHLCHNPRCVEGTHLAWGTRSQNAADSHGRYRSKLTGDHVDEIRASYAAGASQAELARRYSVSPPTIGAIVGGRSWTWRLTPEQWSKLEDQRLGRRPLSLTSRLARRAPQKPPGMSDEEHVNRWVMDMAALHGVSTSMAVEAILNDEWEGMAPLPDSDVAALDPAEVLSLATTLKVSTSSAAAILANR